MFVAASLRKLKRKHNNKRAAEPAGGENQKKDKDKQTDGAPKSRRRKKAPQ